jgi:hypothetical protein
VGELTIVAANVALLILLALAAFQAALIAGTPFGHFAWGGQHRVLPLRLRIGSAVSIVIYAAFAAIIAQRAGLWGFLPAGVVDVGIWVFVAYLALGVPLNAISRSRAERLTMTPVVLVLFLAVLIVALRW